MTNVGAVLITKFVPLIRFHSKHKQKHAMVFSIFIISYLSMGVLIMRRFHTSGHKYLPPDFTPEWLIFYGKMIKTQMITTNLLQYIKPTLEIMIKRCCCCCKRKNYKPNTHLRAEFSLERRYASVLTTCFICFNYGFAIPALFLVASIVFII